MSLANIMDPQNTFEFFHCTFMYQGNDIGAALQTLPPNSTPEVDSPPKKRKRSHRRKPNSFGSKYRRLMEVTNGTEQYWAYDSEKDNVEDRRSAAQATSTRVAGCKRKYNAEADVQSEAQKQRRITREEDVMVQSGEQQHCNAAPSPKDSSSADLESLNDIPQSEWTILQAMMKDLGTDVIEGLIMDLHQDPTFRSWDLSGYLHPN
ncbi:uncharacterized protein LOC125720493 [Brienomyrus brachyistius]|uniref:uncharacterized protein LOC125720493 n=1 Tax=Brienomyrus brachyistius TaxID=42636 RepID=UPI0020B1BD14|nr:uncharacterized protein LOC125720493 [Brienomyrus brachyistius]